jgi:hypothetical protein
MVAAAAAVDLPKVSTGWCASLAPISAAPFLSGRDYSCALLFALITTAAVYLHHAFSARETENFGKIKKPSAQQRCFFIIRGGFEGCVLPYCLRRSIDKCDLHAVNDNEELEGV